MTPETSTETRKCNACGQENPVSHQFCAQCGHDLVFAGDQSEGLQPNPSPAMPGADTLAVLDQLANESGYESSRTRAGWSFAVPLGEERKQNVHLYFSGTDDQGQDWISLLSVCGPVDSQRALSLLRMNSKLAAGTLSIQTLQGREYFVLNEDVTAAEAELGRMRRLIAEIAERSDLVEAQLSGGQDIY